MQANREYRNWINRMRKRYGKKNGVLSSSHLDDPEMEKKWIKSKKNYKRP